MSETPMLSGEELEGALRGAASFVAYPQMPDLSGMVADRLREAPVPSPRRRWARAPADARRLLRPVLRPAFQPALARAAVALAVAVVVLAGTMVFSPSARHAVAGWLG